MLNKNQSKKSNSWKYTLVLPALVAFVSLFQIEVIAQEKVNDVTIKSGIDKAVLDVNSNSTEKELNDERQLFKQEFDIDISFSKVKVNSNNQIIAINVILKNNNGVKKVYLVEEDSPIKPFAIFVEKEKSGRVNFGFQANIKENTNANQHFNHINKSQNASDKVQPRHVVISDVQPDNSWSLNSMTKDGKEYQIILNGTKQVKGIPLKISFDEDFDTQNILDPEEAMLKYGEFGKDGVWEITTKKIKNPKKVLRKKNSKKPLLILNGKKADNQTNIDDINSETIESVNVLKDKDAVDKYGKQAINGAIEVVTKDNKGWGISFGISKPEENISRIQNNKNVDYKKAVVVINGKISDFETLDKLKPDEIDNMTVEKISTNLEARKMAMIKKYGEKALNGIIEVQTKEFHKK